VGLTPLQDERGLYYQIVMVSSILEINRYDQEYPRNWIMYRSANNACD